MTETRKTVEKLKQELQEVRTAWQGAGYWDCVLVDTVEPPATETQNPASHAVGRGASKARAASGWRGLGQFVRFDLAGLGLRGEQFRSWRHAVQTTRSIIEVMDER